MLHPAVHCIGEVCGAEAAGKGLLSVAQGLSPFCHEWAGHHVQRDLPAYDLECTMQGLVTLFVMIGLGIVFGLPYLVARNRRMRKERSSRAEPSALSNILELSRKRDHTN